MQRARVSERTFYAALMRVIEEAGGSGGRNSGESTDGTSYECDECPTCKAEREQAKSVIELRLRQHREEKEGTDRLSALDGSAAAWPRLGYAPPKAKGQGEATAGDIAPR